MMVMTISYYSYSATRTVCDTCGYTSETAPSNVYSSLTAGDTILFKGNSNGAAAKYTYTGDRTNSVPRITLKSVLHDTLLARSASAIFNPQSDSVTIDGFVFLHDGAASPSYAIRGLEYYTPGAFTIINNKFIDNTASKGGIYFDRYSYAANKRSLVRKNVFIGGPSVSSTKYADIDSNIFVGASTGGTLNDTTHYSWNISIGMGSDMNLCGDSIVQEYNWYDSSSGEHIGWDDCSDQSRYSNNNIFRYNHVLHSNHNDMLLDGVMGLKCYNNIYSGMGTGQTYSLYWHNTSLYDSSYNCQFYNNSFLNGYHGGVIFSASAHLSNAISFTNHLYFTQNGGDMVMADCNRDTVSRFAVNMDSATLWGSSGFANVTSVTDMYYSIDRTWYTDTSNFGFYNHNPAITYTANSHPGSNWHLVDRIGIDSATTTGYRVRDSISWALRSPNTVYDWWGSTPNSYYQGDSARVKLYDSSSAATWTLRDSFPHGASLAPAGTVAILHRTGAAAAVKYKIKTVTVTNTHSGSLIDTISLSTDTITTSSSPVGRAHYVDTMYNPGTNWSASTDTSHPVTWRCGMDSAKAGDTVYFRGRVFDVDTNPPDPSNGKLSCLMPKVSGKVDSQIVFMSYGLETPILRGLVKPGEIACRVIGVLDKSYITIDGFSCQADSGKKTAAINIWSDTPQHGNVVKNCIINGGTTVNTWSDNLEGLRIEKQVGLLAKNCTIFNFNETDNNHNTSAIKMYDNDSCTIRNLKVYNCSNGLYAKRSNSHCVFKYNFVRNCYLAGLEDSYLTNYSNGNKWHDNVIINCDDWLQWPTTESGIHDSLQIYNNTIYGTAARIAWYVGRIKIYNNILSSSSGTTSLMNFCGSSPDTMILEECDHNNYNGASLTFGIYQNEPSEGGPRRASYASLASWKASTNLNGGGNPDDNSISSNPLFVNTSGTMDSVGDFRLAVNSPCKGTGRLNVDMGANIDSIIGSSSPSGVSYKCAITIVR